MSEGARGGGRGSVGTVLVARRAILIESGEGLAAKARNDEQPCNPVEHDRRYFTPTTFKRRCTHATPHEGTGSPRIIIPFQVNRLYLAMQVSRPSFSLLSTPPPCSASRQPRVAPLSLLFASDRPVFPLSFRSLINDRSTEATFKQILSFYCLFAQVLLRTYVYFSLVSFSFSSFFLGLTERWLGGGGGQGRMFVLEEYELCRIFFFFLDRQEKRESKDFF